MSVKIVEITGGLGNQMFQFAFGKYLEKRFADDRIEYDLSYYEAQNAIRKFELEDAFGISVVAASKDDIRRVQGYYLYDNFMDKVFNKIFAKAKEHGEVIIENLDKEFLEENVYSNGDAYYSGYWQSEDCFKAFRGELLLNFRFNVDEITLAAQKILSKMKSSNSVAIHVRLDDYLKEDNFRIYGNVCTKDYYSRAIMKIKDSVSDCKFFLFSTDSQKALDFLPNDEDYTIVEYYGQKDYLDMFLMTNCKHNIIANSTFSWWGAWLNQNKEKVVVCPTKWFNTHDVYNQYCEGWIRV